jgi:hypothetical protein
MRNNFQRNLTSRQEQVNGIHTHRRNASIFIAALITMLFGLAEDTAFSIELKIRAIAPVPRDSIEIKQHNQLPQSRIATGNRNISSAWFAGATDRYRHGVLGDHWEASRLDIETIDGKRLQVNLPHTRVFEDLEPRLADVNGDNNDEIIVVESDTKLGASLAVYGIEGDQLVRIAATPFLGQPNRWLNPLGVGDFDGDGQADIALVATPHIGGVLRLYRFKDVNLSLFAEFPGVSTHRLGSTEMGLGRVIDAFPRDQLLVPNQTRQEIMLLEWTPSGWQEITHVELSGYLGSSLVPLKSDRWVFRSESGQFFEIHLEQ